MSRLALLAFLFAVAAPVRAELMISEFLASNSNSIRDEDGDHEDWIEIYNNTGASVNLLGWYLTDDINQPRKWPLPARSLDSGAHLLVFASDKNRPRLTGNPHTNFKLDTDGEYLALVRDVAGGGVQAVQVFNPYPRQATDVAFGTQVTVTNTPLVAPNAPAKSLVPTMTNGGDALPYPAWTGAPANEPFDDSAWIAGTTPVGFATSGVATANLKLRLNANTSAGITEDTSGAAHHGTNNAATWTAETSDAAGQTRHGTLLFGATDSNGTGTGDQVVVPAHADFNVTSGTIMFWIKTAGNVPDGGAVEGAMVFDRRVGTGVGQGLVMILRDNGTLQIQPSPGGGVQPNTFPSTAAVRDDRWHHVALVFNTTSGQPCTFFVDGAVAGSRNNTANWSFNAAQQIEIGRSHDTYWRRLNGQLDDFRFYNAALTQEQIQQIVANEDEPVTPGTDLQAAMLNVNPSAFVRVPFTVSDPAAFDGVNLTMRWNDGFIAWINGTQVGSFAAPATPAYNSAATQSHSAGAPFVIPISPGGTLRTGANVLAIQALNNSVANGAFMVAPQLDGTNTTIGAAGYLVTPTPGAVNSGAKSNLGPFVTNVTRNPGRPLGTAESRPLTITATVLPSLRPLAGTDPVQLKFRVMYAAEQSVTMFDNGVAPDGTANDNIYSAEIATNTLGAGQMLRWRIVATDNTGITGAAPEFSDPTDNEQYFGTVAIDPSIQSNLPVLYWFIQTPSQADNATGTRCSIFYKAPGDDEEIGRFYDNVEVNIHGQSSSGFAKKSYDFDFNEDNRFEWNAAQDRVKDINLLTNWGDKTKTHNALTHEVAAAVGSAAHWCYQVRVQQVTATNAANPGAHFFSIADMMEDGDDDWLERIGRDPEGALYKAYNSLNASSGLEKKTRRHEGKSDADALIAGLNPGSPLATRRAFAYDNLDLPQCVSYFVAMALTSSQDHGHKNYYVYRDTRGTGEWSIFPWDTDLSWGRNWTDAGAYFTDTIYTNNVLNMYPGYNDGGQVVQNKGAMNRLYTIIFDSPEFRTMYLRRLRTTTDNYFAVPGLLEGRIDAMTDAMDPPTIALSDADRDRTKWGTWGNNGGFTVGGEVLRYHIGILKNNYLAGRRAWLNSANAKLFFTGGGSEAVPVSQSATAADSITIETVEFNPATGSQGHEYFVLRNSGTEAVDVSGWQITGAVTLTLKPGTVLPAGGGVTQHVGDLFVAKNPLSFRQGAAVDGGRQFCFVQGPYDGQLSARGETIELRNPAGALLKTRTWTPAPTAMQNQLRLTELNYAPSAPTATESAALPGVVESDFEYLELMNIGTTPVDLGGANFDSGITFTFPSGYTLAAGARCLVVANRAAFQLRYGAASDSQIAGVFGGNLDNNGEPLQIVDNVGENILDFRYDDDWFPPSNEGGRSLVVRSAAPDWQTYDLPATWALSGNVNGSPGSGDADTATVYEGWRHAYFTPVQVPSSFAGLETDADGDGLTNLAEYAFGHDPRTEDNAALATAGVVNTGGTDYLAITFQRRHKALDLTWSVEASNDLQNWETVDLPVGAPERLNGDLDRVTYRDSQPVGAGRRFLRVRVVK